MTGGRQVTIEGAAEVLARGGRLWCGADDLSDIRRSVVKRVGDGQAAAVDAALAPLADGEELALGRRARLRAVLTPGHTPGSLCVLVGSVGGAIEGAVCGDTMFIGSVGRTDLPGSDQLSMLRSVLRLAQLPPSAIVFPGHNYAAPPHSTIEAERDSNPWVMQALKLQAAGRLDAPQGLGTSAVATQTTCVPAAPADEAEGAQGEAGRPWWRRHGHDSDGAEFCELCHAGMQPFVAELLAKL